MRKFTIILFILFYTYAILRYHVGKDIPWNEWYFILNKAFAWMGFSLIALSILQQSFLNKYHLTRRSLGMTGFLFACIHAISILFLFNSQHYPKFYSGSQINILGWITIAIGLLSIIIFSLPFVATLKNVANENKVFRLGKIGVLISILHPLLIGFSGWFDPETWPFYLPPITMLAVLTGIVVFGVRGMKEMV